MRDDTELQALEAELYRSRFDDGLVDVLFGVVVVAWGVGLMLGMGALAAVVAAIAVVLWPLLRHRLISLRTGYVELSGGRRRLELRKAGLLVAIGGGLLVLFGMVVVALREGTDRRLLEVLAPGIGGLLLALPAFVSALLTGVGRFGVYALVLLVGALLGMVGWLTLEVYVVVCGGIIVVLGAVQMARFLRAHPVREV
jgi:hypothetical protein